MSNPDRYAVIGHPVGHSRSPFIHLRFAAQTGQAIEYTTIDASPAQFGSTAKDFLAAGGKGLNITLPHKEAALSLVDELTPRAQRAGAINTVAVRGSGGGTSLLGDNTDGAGLARDLLNNHHVTVAGRRVLLLGAGGAARGVLAPLLGLKPSALTIVNRNVARAQELVARFRDMGRLHAIGYDQLDGDPYDLVINATAASLAGDLPPLPPGIVNSRSICYDMGYGRDDTPFVRWAHQRGCARALMGLGMLVEQAAEAFFLWRGVRPDTASVLSELGAELQASGSTAASR
jgi:shikimate dehydrogenase